MKKTIFLFIIIFLEGYVVLSAELLSLRLIIPFAGSGTDTASIIIAAVLMPLAFGYYAGGMYKDRNKARPKKNIREKLRANILLAAIFLSLSLSYLFVELFFTSLSQLGIHNRLVISTLYALIFLIVPVFLLAQTIPLVSHYFTKEKLSQITGKMLFFSTLGSFAGAVFSTLVLMAYLGVHYTAVITIGCLFILYIALSTRRQSLSLLFMALVFGGMFAANNNYILGKFGVIENNQYNTIHIKTLKGDAIRILSLNNNASSLLVTQRSPLNPSVKNITSIRYINYIDNIIKELAESRSQNISVLVLGAGGFTIGLNDSKNDYIFVDIDSSLKDISEDYFLERKLQPNKKFVAEPARSFLYKARQNNQKYDIVVLDVFQGGATLPQSLITQEGLQNMKDVLKSDGVFMANFITSPNFDDKLSIHLDNTLKTVFPSINRQLLYPFKEFTPGIIQKPNSLYVYYKKTDNENGIYKDDKNRSYSDRDKPIR